MRWTVLRNLLAIHVSIFTIIQWRDSMVNDLGVFYYSPAQRRSWQKGVAVFSASCRGYHSALKANQRAFSRHNPSYLVNPVKLTNHCSKRCRISQLLAVISEKVAVCLVVNCSGLRTCCPELPEAARCASLTGV
jgi:hypothetical protein